LNRPKITCVHWSISGTLAERLVTQTDQKARLCRCRLPDDDEGSEATDNSSGGNSLLISIFFQTSDRPPLAAANVNLLALSFSNKIEEFWDLSAELY
jgi:hypothetical protein